MHNTTETADIRAFAPSEIHRCNYMEMSQNCLRLTQVGSVDDLRAI
jgi:hypothetical protein